MKTDLATSVIAAIIGVVAAYFITNLFIGKIESYSYTTIDTSVNSELVYPGTTMDTSVNYSELVEPDVEVFNYKALNPTVEVYVGECEESDAYGGCIDAETQENP